VEDETEVVDDDTVSTLQVLIFVVTDGNGGGDEVDNRIDSGDNGDKLDSGDKIGSGDRMIVDGDGNGDGVDGDNESVSWHVKVDVEAGDGADEDVGDS